MANAKYLYEFKKQLDKPRVEEKAQKALSNIKISPLSKKVSRLQGAKEHSEKNCYVTPLTSL